MPIDFNFKIDILFFLNELKKLINKMKKKLLPSVKIENSLHL